MFGVPHLWIGLLWVLVRINPLQKAGGRVSHSAGKGSWFSVPLLHFHQTGLKSVHRQGLDSVLHEVVCHVLTSQVQDGMGEGIALIDGYSVGNPVPSVHHNAAGTTRDIQGQHSLAGYVHDWGVEGLKHELGHLLQLALGSKGASVKHGVLLRGSHSTYRRRCINSLSSQLVTVLLLDVLL